MFYNIRLKTRVSEEGLHYQFFPIHLKERTIPFRDIESFKARKYSPFKEFGGWGIRFGFEGKAYNVSGKEGLQLVLKKQKKSFIRKPKSERTGKSYEKEK